MKLARAMKTKIKNDALKNIKRMNKDGKMEIARDLNLYLYEKELSPGKKIIAGPDKKIPLSKRTALVFADTAPGFNWGHPCQHILYDTETGKMYKKVDAEFPPLNFFTNHEEFDAFHTPVKPVNVLNERKLRAAPVPVISTSLINAPGNRYAILFSGMSNNRHVNDLEFLYRTLIDIYQFDPANIYVLNFNGTIDYNGSPHPVGNWPGDNTPYRMQVNGEGTKATLENVFDDLATKLQEDDFLIIHTNNHGGHGTESYLCCYPSWGSYGVSDFADKLNSLPQFAALVVMMEQCHSGGFSDPIIAKSPAKRTHFAAACEEDRSSIGGANFDPFAYDWIAGMTGQYADGSGLTQLVDTNLDGRISAEEAFTYANAVHDPYDTPVSAASPAGCGAYLFLGLPDHDLFIRDNLQDDGTEPLIEGGISRSPDIIVFNQELNDPQQILGSSGVRDKDDLGEPMEYGQDNFIYLRIQNKGTKSTSGTAKLYWTHSSTFPTPSSWSLIDEIEIPAVTPDEFKVVGPVIFLEDFLPSPGHYCFIALIGSGSDPAPDPSTIQSYDDFYHFIRESNNATWKNFNIIDMFKGTINKMKFYIQGWDGNSIYSDLKIDLQELPLETNVTLHILKRLTEDSSLEGLELIDESKLYCRYKLTSGKVVFLQNMKLNESENSLTSLKFELPESIKNGAYNIMVAQVVDGLEMGRITQMFAVGDHPFTANLSLHEIHKSDCPWVEKMSRKHMVAYTSLERALKHGYNGCYYCLPKYDKDNTEAMMKTIEPILIEAFYGDSTDLSEEELNKLHDVEEKIVTELKKAH